ncbi:MAG: hypothetical protein ACOX4K_03830 [Bacillota bacterium]
MVSREKKLDALYTFSVMVIQNPLFSYLLGYLAGQIDRVHFVEDLSGADIAIRLCIRRSALWPREPFQATVRGVSMPSPLSLVRAVNNDDSQICVFLDFDSAHEAAWYREVLLPDVSYIKDAAEAAREESDNLRREMNKTLDIYRECKAMLNTGPPEKKEEMSFYIRLAEQQLRSLSSQLEDLNKRMKELKGS